MFYSTQNTTLRLIALNDPWSGNMNGIQFINFQCQREAYRSGVSGLFRAFLSSPKDRMELSSIVKNPYDIIVNLKNETLYSNWGSIFKRTKFMENDAEKNLYSFNGKNVIFDEHW